VVLWEWINELLSQMEIEPVKKRTSVRTAYGMGWCFEKMYGLFRRKDEPPMTRFLAKALSCSHYYDISRAKRDFRYQPIVENTEGMRLTVEWLNSI
jgi:nucleoside-diphosphate-sugar epimerase